VQYLRRERHRGGHVRDEIKAAIKDSITREEVAAATKKRRQQLEEAKAAAKRAAEEGESVDTIIEASTVEYSFEEDAVVSEEVPAQSTIQSTPTSISEKRRRRLTFGEVPPHPSIAEREGSPQQLQGAEGEGEEATFVGHVSQAEVAQIDEAQPRGGSPQHRADRSGSPAVSPIANTEVVVTASSTGMVDGGGVGAVKGGKGGKGMKGGKGGKGGKSSPAPPKQAFVMPERKVAEKPKMSLQDELKAKLEKREALRASGASPTPGTPIENKKPKKAETPTVMDELAAKMANRRKNMNDEDDEEEDDW